MAAARVADIAARLRERQRVYEAAYAGDVHRLRAEHGAEPVSEALALIEQRTQGAADSWDRAGHRRAVERGIGRALAEHHEQHNDEPQAPGPVLPPGWR
jgi:hypothetical protein